MRRQVDEAKLRQDIIGFIGEVNVMGANPDIDPDKPLADYGVDSLDIVEICMIIEDEYLVDSQDVFPTDPGIVVTANVLVEWTKSLLEK